MIPHCTDKMKNGFTAPDKFFLSALFLPFLLLFTECQKKDKLFSRLETDRTHIDFENTLTETHQNNIMKYEYFYNGGGVGVGDINNDGLPDLYFTGNQVENKLYLNKGNLAFEDITGKAGVAGRPNWKTGVCMADVNGDGWLDIYVCYSGKMEKEQRANQLFINNGVKEKGGVPTFTERAKEYGLDGEGAFTTQVSFFDYDLDGDLDMFMVNHADMFFNPFFNTTRLRSKRHPFFSNRLYRNNEGHFEDVSEKAGIFGGANNFSLNVSVGDINGDGYPDMYVTNDYEEQDFLYLNNKNGTFTEVAKKAFGHISRNTMGTDLADYNNDLMPDLISLDMLPEGNRRQKMLKGPDEFDRYQMMVDSGYHHQNMRNMLQLNRGITKEGIPVFSEIGQLAGISATDWSWSALLADYDNDGLKDLYITNGIMKDFTNQDFVKYDVPDARVKAQASGLDLSTPEAYEKNFPVSELIKQLSSEKVPNYIFRNKGNLTFQNTTEDWGLNDENISTGAAYADLDNDGDLDLITSNINEKATIYRNNAEKLTGNKFLKIKLNGTGKNRFGTGAKVYLDLGNSKQYQEAIPVRGFQSSVENVLNFGLGKQNLIRQVKVVWPDGKEQVLNQIKANTTLVFDQKMAKMPVLNTKPVQNQLFEDISQNTGLDFVHKEDLFVDFKGEPLIPYQLSRQGPKLAKADVNGDGLEDIFVGGAIYQSGKLYLQQNDGRFSASKSQPWEADKESENIGTLFFDADGDGDQDLYVVSGSNEWQPGSPQLQDHLYLNDSKGNFTKSLNGLPVEHNNGSCVKACDFDKDGDLDLFVGGRAVAGKFPVASESMLLRNETIKGKEAKFINATKLVCPELTNAGMVTDAVWSDADGDGWVDLIVAGDWMPVRIFKNNRGKLTDISNQAGLEKTGGMWTSVLANDFDKDGDTDFVLGNAGQNSYLQASENEPLVMYVSDFNDDGRIDPIICHYIQRKSYPIASRDEMLDQLVGLKKRFVRYSDYADATIEDIFTGSELRKANQLSVHTLQSIYLENLGKGKFKAHVLPLEAQFSMNQGILSGDFNKDQKEDILLVGNCNTFKVQLGRCDASLGVLLLGDGKGNFKPASRQETGLYVNGDVRDVIKINNRNGQTMIVISKNNAALQSLRMR